MEADGGTQIVGLLYPGNFVGMLFANRSADTIAALGVGRWQRPWGWLSRPSAAR